MTHGRAEDVFLMQIMPWLTSYKTGDTKDNITSFIEAVEDTDITSNESHSTIFGKIVKSIKTLRSNKFDKSNILQTAEVSDPAKVNSSVVINGLAQSVNAISDKLGVKTDVVLTGLVGASNNGASATRYSVKNGWCLINLNIIIPTAISTKTVIYRCTSAPRTWV